MTNNRVAIVTGASGGIGEAIARRLATDGYDVAITDLQSRSDGLERLQKEIIALGHHCRVFLADATSETDVCNLVDNTVKELGRLDVMVANAGILAISPLTECTTETWDRIFSVNVRGVFFCFKYAANAMIAQGQGGRIIAASSEAGKQGKGFAAAYSASKFAVRGLTQSAAQELGKHGITVNSYAPGPIKTTISSIVPLTEAAVSAFQSSGSSVTDVGRVGEPDEIAHVVSYLASKEAGFVTGQTISVNGGQYFD